MANCAACSDTKVVRIEDGDLGSKFVECRACKAKMVLVYRADLKNRKGKIGSQCGHAAVAAYKTADRNDPAFIEWDTQEFTKICVSVNSEQELLSVAGKAKDSGLNVAVIRDAGHTEFHGVPTLTCLAIGPAYGYAFEGLTSQLPLY
jgi:peptidyl-tRNA hydrolase, PTH2 family